MTAVYARIPSSSIFHDRDSNKISNISGKVDITEIGEIAKEVYLKGSKERDFGDGKSKKYNLGKFHLDYVISKRKEKLVVNRVQAVNLKTASQKKMTNLKRVTNQKRRTNPKKVTKRKPNLTQHLIKIYWKNRSR